MLIFSRFISAISMLMAIALLFQLGPLRGAHYQTFGFMHIVVVIVFFVSFAYFKKDVQIMSTFYDLRKTMEGIVRKTGSAFTQVIVVFTIAAIWLSPVLLCTLWWSAGELKIDMEENAIPLLWAVLSLSAFIYMCLLNPIIRKKYK